MLDSFANEKDFKSIPAVTLSRFIERWRGQSRGQSLTLEMTAQKTRAGHKRITSLPAAAFLEHFLLTYCIFLLVDPPTPHCHAPQHIN